MFAEKITGNQKIVLLGATITLIALTLRIYSDIRIVVNILTSFQIGMGLGLMYGILLLMQFDRKS